MVKQKNKKKIGFIFVFYCCYNILPQTWWVKKTQMYYAKFYRSKVWHGSRGAKIKVPAELCSCLEAPGENSSPHPFHLPQATHIPCLRTLCLHLQPSSVACLWAFHSQSHLPVPAPWSPSGTFKHPGMAPGLPHKAGASPRLQTIYPTTLTPFIPAALLLHCPETEHIHRYRGDQYHHYHHR